MPIYCESITKFWGEGTNQIYEWAQDGDEGVFFARVFGHDYENASDDDWDLWEDEYISYGLCNMGCHALKNEDGSINLTMRTIRLIPTGVFEKIAELFPNIHADGRFIQQTEEFFGNIVIEKGTFLWTNFHNPGIRSKNDDFRFTDFFADRYKDVEDKEQLEVLKLLQYDRDNLRSMLQSSDGKYTANKKINPKKLNYKSDFYFSDLELKAISGDSDSQLALAIELEDWYQYVQNNPEIYYPEDEDLYAQDSDLMELSWLEKAAINGNAKAQYKLAEELPWKTNGNEAKEKALFIAAVKNGCEEAIKDGPGGCPFGIEIDDEILKAFEEIANKGSVCAMIALSDYCADESDDENWLKWLHKAADAGDSDSLKTLASLYLEGEVIEKDNAKAIELYKRASEKGDADASFSLAKIYATGQIIDKDITFASVYLKLADYQGNTFAKCYSLLQDGNDEKVYSFISKEIKTKWSFSPNLENGDALLTLPFKYYMVEDAFAQLYGAKTNYKKAFSWLNKVSKMGSFKVSFYLGKAYYDGLIVTKNYKKAFELFVCTSNAYSCSRDYPKYYLAQFYLNGFYVPRNLFMAKKLFKYCVQQGDAKSKDMLKLVNEQIKKEGLTQDETCMRQSRLFENAVLNSTNGKLGKAITEFYELGNYLDSEERLKDVSKAFISAYEDLLRNQKTKSANALLNTIPKEGSFFKDLVEKCVAIEKDIVLNKANEAFSNEEYAKAFDLLATKKEWNEAEALSVEIKDCIYNKALEKIKGAEYIDAIKLLKIIPDWKDSNEQLNYAKNNKRYYVGSVGPAGGIIFFAKKQASDGWQYLEASTSPSPKRSWGKVDNGQTDTCKGSGKENTKKIVSKSEGQSLSAAQYCINYEQNGFKDWFLPSRDELVLILKVKKKIPNIDDLFLVSSSEAEEVSRVWYLKVSSGELKKCAKDFPMRFIPIRAF